MGVDGGKVADRPGKGTRLLRRCPSEPALMPTSAIYMDNDYMSMDKTSVEQHQGSATLSTRTAKTTNTVDDDYMYMKSGALGTTNTVSATSVATATMKKKSPTPKKVPKTGGGSKLPPSSGIGVRKLSPSRSRPRASTLNPQSRGGARAVERPMGVTAQLPAVLPKPKGSATLSSAAAAATGPEKNGLGESVQSRIDKLRGRCNSDKPERYKVNKRTHGTLTADRRSCSMDKLSTAGAAQFVDSSGGGGVRAGIKAFGKSAEPPLPMQGKVGKLKKTHSRSHSTSGSNASLGVSPAPPALPGRRSPKDFSVSPTSSGYSSSGE